MANLEFFFDLSSPWTRIAFHNVQAIVRDNDATVRWRPFLVGGVFNAVNDSVYAGRADPNAPKNRHTFKWLKDWARLAGVPMNFPSRHHPLKSVQPMRWCCVIEDDQAALHRFATEAFDAYFTEKLNIDDADVLRQVAERAGLDGAWMAARAADDDIKQRLRANTQEVIDRGGFGSPTMFVDGGDLYFGNDQLPLVAMALAAR